MRPGAAGGGMDGPHPRRGKIAEGFAAIECGEGIAWTPPLMDELERETDALYRRGKQPDPDVRPSSAGRPVATGATRGAERR